MKYDNVFFVVSHKKFSMPFKKEYLPILVGEKNFKMTGAYRDDFGKSISYKNSSFCELTAIYWVWKNFNSKYKNICFCHYRRYFSKVGFLKTSRFFLDSKDLDIILNDYDVILPRPKKINCTVYENYFEEGQGKKKDIDLTLKIISDFYPSYLDAFKSVLNQTSLSYYNMFAMKKEDFNNYCSWLFSILFKIEKEIDITSYSVSQARVFGYLGEILLNVWIKKNNLKCKFIPVVKTDAKQINLIRLYLLKKI
jgi:hypothetical protein